MTQQIKINEDCIIFYADLIKLREIISKISEEIDKLETTYLKVKAKRQGEVICGVKSDKRFVNILKDFRCNE